MKKFHFVRIVCLLIGAVLLAASFAGCGGKENPPSESGTGTESNRPGNTTVSATEEETVPSNIEENLRFDGKMVNVYIRTSYQDLFDVEYTGAVVDNAIYTRNLEVSERLGVTLNYETYREDGSCATLSQTLTNYHNGGITASMGAPHIVAFFAYYGTALAVQGLYYNLVSESESNYLDMSKPWYNANFVSENLLNDTLYFSVGDFNLTATDRLVVTYMNKKALVDYSIDDIDYINLVNEGKWTFEYLKNLIQDVYQDLNGNGRTADDFFGYGVMKGSASVDALLISAGLRITSRSENGGVELVLNSDSNQRAYSAVYDFYYQAVDGMKVFEPNFVVAGEYNGTDLDYMSDQMFYEGKLVFASGLLKSAKVFAKNPSISYQILPLPKLTESADEQYCTTAQDGYDLVSIPSVNLQNDEDIKLATVALECLSEYSYRTVRPAYFEVAFKTRYASDSDTAILFDRIVDNAVYDFGFVNSHLMSDPVWAIRDSFIGKPERTDGTKIPVESYSRICTLYGEQIAVKFGELLEDYAGYSKE